MPTRICLAATLLLSLMEGACAMSLSVDGRSDYTITVARDAIVPEMTAATELQSHLRQVTGAELPIRTEAEVPQGAKQIVVGPGPRFKAACPKVDLPALKHDGIVMRTVGDNLYLAGGRPRGTLYAVYSFLEDIVGCRWWSATESFVPTKPSLDVPELDTVYLPKLQCREAFYRGAFDGIYAARSKCNGHFERVPAEYGGHYTIIGWCHTFNQILPPEKYFKDHPEWYSEIGGKRLGGGGERVQLCLTNEEMLAEFTKNTLEWVRKDPGAGMISISQNDWHGQCQCEKCAALEQHEGSPAGPVIHFVNAVAEAIEKEFPDFLVETLAYSYTRKPPKHVTPRDNVVIRLCSIECSYSQPLETGPQNKTFKEDIEQWSEVAPQLYIWNYVTNFRNYILPHPNMRVLAPNIRFFVEHNAIGLFEQGDSGCSCSDFPELRAWLLAHLMWDPSRDESALIKEFMTGYYGAAGVPLLEYINLIHDSVEEAGTYLRCYMADTRDWFDLTAVSRATGLFDQAAKLVADDSVLSRRVRRARMPLDHVWLQRYHALKREARGTGVPFVGPADVSAACDDFIKTAHAFNVGSFREGRPFSAYEATLRARSGPSAPAPDIAKGLPEDDWADIQEFEFNLHGLGKWVTVVDDAKASNGRAARMGANHNSWATQYPVSADIAAMGKSRSYAVVRVDCKAQEGAAFEMGIYDGTNSKAVMAVTRSIAETGDGQYVTYDFGVHELKRGMYFWFAPKNNPDQVEAIYVDRIVCIQEK